MRIWTALIIQLALGAAMAQAQGLSEREEREALLRSPTNTFVTGITPIGPHPKCSGLGAFAFEAEFNAPSISYLAHDADNKGLKIVLPRANTVEPDKRKTCISHTIKGGERVTREVYCPRENSAIMQRNEKACFTYESRGTERVRVAIACPKDKKPEPPQFNAKAAFSGTATICMSLTGISLIDGSWSVTLTDKGDTRRTTGSFRDIYPQDDTLPPTGVVSLGLRGQTTLTTHHLNVGALDDRRRFDTVDESFFSVSLGCVPLQTDTAPLFLASELRFMLEKDTATECTGTRCPWAYRNGRGIPYKQRCQVPPGNG